ncbi:hypothetical protein WG66_016142 [Moniliophthora roreri]|nr:hypothetical protein WG66_016142 [Moniliophthora roreri]
MASPNAVGNWLPIVTLSIAVCEFLTYSFSEGYSTPFPLSTFLSCAVTFLSIAIVVNYKSRLVESVHSPQPPTPSLGPFLCPSLAH